MRVIVLGAGLLGVTSAYFLSQLGHEVTVIDRQGTPGAETSFANGGQISVSHAEPWANPSAPLKVLQWLGQEDAPLLFRIRADMRQWLWGLSFLRNCTPARTRHNIEQIVRLGTYSRDTLQQLRAATGIQYDQRTQGILHFYTNQKEFDGALAPAEPDALREASFFVDRLSAESTADTAELMRRSVDLRRLVAEVDAVAAGLVDVLLARGMGQTG